MDDSLKNYSNRMYQGLQNRGSRAACGFELSVKLYFYFYALQSVEILLSGIVVSD